VVAIQNVGEPAEPYEFMFQCKRNGAFAGCGQAGKPKRGSSLLQQLFPLVAGDMAFMPGNVGGFVHGFSGVGYQVTGVEIRALAYAKRRSSLFLRYELPAHLSAEKSNLTPDT